MTPPGMAQGTPPQIPQNAALFSQLTQGMPQGAPQGMPPGMPQGAPPQAPPMMPPGGAGGPPPQMQPGLPPPGSPQPPQASGMQRPAPRFTPQELAALGRYGDTIVAHLTPGEIAVPPQVQTPKVLATIKQAFEQKDVDPQKFTAGSPQSSINPNTGVSEYNFLSAFLPMALGIAGGAFLPGLMPALSPLLAGSIGTGAGSALGGIISGQNPMQALLGGAGAGLGSYGLGSLMAPAAGAGGAGAAAQSIQPQAATSASAGANGLTGAAPQMSMIPSSPMSMPQMNAAQSAALGTPVGGESGGFFSPQRIGQSLGAGLGGMIGNSLYTPPAKNSGDDSSSSNQHFPSPENYGNWQDSLGNTTYKGPKPNFSGYNAADPNSNRWTFYPTS